MPGFNGTGPKGKGPMTGRGRGYCVVRLNGKGDTVDKGTINNQNIPEKKNPREEKKHNKNILRKKKK